MATEKTVNYTPEMVEVIRAAAPLNFEIATTLGEQLGKNVRSIIAKAKREGIEYISKPAPAKKKPTGLTKAETVAAIATAVDVDSLEGLEKATGSALGKLLAAIVK